MKLKKITGFQQWWKLKAMKVTSLRMMTTATKASSCRFSSQRIWPECKGLAWWPRFSVFGCGFTSSARSYFGQSFWLKKEKEFDIFVGDIKVFFYYYSPILEIFLWSGIFGNISEFRGRQETTVVITNPITEGENGKKTRKRQKENNKYSSKCKLYTRHMTIANKIYAPTYIRKTDKEQNTDSSRWVCGVIQSRGQPEKKETSWAITRWLEQRWK